MSINHPASVLPDSPSSIQEVPAVQNATQESKEQIMQMSFFVENMEKRIGRKMMHLPKMIDVLSSTGVTPAQLLHATAEERFELLRAACPSFADFSFSNKKIYLVPRVWYPLAHFLFPDDSKLSRIAEATLSVEKMGKFIQERKFHLTLQKKIDRNDCQIPVSFLGMNMAEVCALLGLRSGNVDNYRHTYQRIIETVRKADSHTI